MPDSKTRAGHFSFLLSASRQPMGSAVPRRFRIRSARRACKEAQRPPNGPNRHDGQQNEEHPAVEPGGQQMQLEHNRDFWRVTRGSLAKEAGPLKSPEQSAAEELEILTGFRTGHRLSKNAFSGDCARANAPEQVFRKWNNPRGGQGVSGGAGGLKSRAPASERLRQAPLEHGLPDLE